MSIMQKVLDWLQSHTLIAAIIIFVVIFIAYNAFKNSKTTGTTATGTGIPPGTGQGGLTGSEVYASSNYQYPTYNAPVVQQNAPAPTTPAASTPTTTAAPASASIYHGLLSVVGSIHPASIGPWITGRTVTISGDKYTLKTGTDGRLWGMNSAGKQVNLWDGNDYAGGARTAATVGGVA